MSHMVIYRGADGAPGYHQADEVHDAVAFVENLRNREGVEEARIFRMEHVNFEYRPYFRVELTTGDASLAAAPEAPAVSPAPEGATPTPAPAPEPSSKSEPEADTPTPDPPSGDAPAPVVSPVRSITDAPTIGSPAAEGDNGVGARRGLFGR